MKTGLTLLAYIACALIVLSFIYGLYYVGKNVSYVLFYQGMVEDTIIEMVEASALKPTGD